LKILHVTFENFQDVPGLLSRSHAFFGDQGALVTMSRSKLGFPNGILLNYPMLNSPVMRRMRSLTGRENVNVPDDRLTLRIRGNHWGKRLFLTTRDLLWLERLHNAWQRFRLDSYDIYHFDGNMPFIFGDRILKKLKDQKKHLVTHFFGTDLRKWGMNPYLKDYAELRFTSEVDHTKIDPSLIFVPIPYEADRVTPRENENATLRIGHSPTRRTAKGTQDIIDSIARIPRKDLPGFEFVLIENVSHRRCMEIKATCDIGIDQVGNYAGTAYGRSGLEFLALGIPTITEIPDEYECLLPGHPFIKATKDTLADVVAKTLRNGDLRRQKREQGIDWVRTFPHPRRIISRMYEEYHRLGWK